MGWFNKKKEEVEKTKEDIEKEEELDIIENHKSLLKCLEVGKKYSILDVNVNVEDLDWLDDQGYELIAINDWDYIFKNKQVKTQQ